MTSLRLPVRVAVFLAPVFMAAYLLAAAQTGARGLMIAAASDLQFALPDIATQFEQQTGQKVALTFGSSGNFFTQIQNGAPFDVFLSADIDYPKRLAASGYADRGTLFEYAIGRLVLWTRRDSGIDVERGLTAAVDDRRVRHIALANPEHAPYGRAAVAALRHEGLYARVQDRFVFGENISQAAQFAQSGSADIGLLALSLALSPALKESGIYVEIPTGWYPPIEQAAVVLTSSRQQSLARQFVEALKKPETVRILQAYGFAVPHPATR